MKIYTRSGDDGQTSLFGGERVLKTNPRVAAYGSVDETNSLVGLARAFLTDDPALNAVLERLQVLLFDLGADLATPPGSPGERHVMRVTETDVSAMEGEIDALDARLPQLTSFILPGGAPAAGALHAARCASRRAERDALAADAAGEAINRQALLLLNRLSDFLFMAARAANQHAGQPETAWRARR